MALKLQLAPDEQQRQSVAPEAGRKPAKSGTGEKAAVPLAATVLPWNDADSLQAWQSAGATIGAPLPSSSAGTAVSAIEIWISLVPCTRISTSMLLAVAEESCRACS